VLVVLAARGRRRSAVDGAACDDDKVQDALEKKENSRTIKTKIEKIMPYFRKEMGATVLIRKNAKDARWRD